MTISVTAFKTRCLQLIKHVEDRAEPIELTRRGKVVARILPTSPHRVQRPWERLRGSGRLLASPSESVLRDEEFDALK